MNRDASFLTRREQEGIMGLPASIHGELSKLDPKLQEEFTRKYTRRRKSLLIAYLLCLLGWHYLYLGRITLQIAFLATMAGFLIWGLVDLFRLPGMVARQNEGIAWDVMSEYRTQSTGRLADFLA
jgi:TM2 domain